MNCKIESMSENRKNQVDTLPPRGRVNEVRREWLVHEDGALAYRLQDEEIKQHLIGNKSRNLQIREDFPRAKNEQLREVEEAAKLHQQLLLQQEQQDAKIAAQLADYIEKEEEERKRMLEEEDKELAKLLQEKEQRKISRKERDLRELETHTPRKDKYFYYDDKRSHVFQKPIFDKNGELSKAEASKYLQLSASSTNHSTHYNSDNLSDINNVGLPLQDEIVQPLRNCSISNQPRFASTNDIFSVGMSEDEARRIQEAKDEEYARFLQEKENLENLDTVNKDRLLAIETQDKELARLLQEKERAKARRARERAKQKAALKKMQEKVPTEEPEGDADWVAVKTAETVSVNSHRKSDGTLSSLKDDFSYPQPDLVTRNLQPKPRYPDPEEIVELPEEKTPVSNIAMTIDPTYNKEGLEGNPKLKKGALRNSKSYENEETTLMGLTGEDVVKDGNAPPYMPIQGQRRLPEKKSKQKDGCKQQ